MGVEVQMLGRSVDAWLLPVASVTSKNRLMSVKVAQK